MSLGRTVTRHAAVAAFLTLSKLGHTTAQAWSPTTEPVVGRAR